jgi:hypothetical protein
MLYQVGRFGLAGIIICVYCSVVQINLPLDKTLLLNVISDKNYYLLLILFELTCRLGWPGTDHCKACSMKHDQTRLTGAVIGQLTAGYLLIEGRVAGCRSYFLFVL